MVPGCRAGRAHLSAQMSSSLLCSGCGGKRMRIGVLKEVKANEYRIGLVPGSVRELVHHGQEVVVQAGAGEAIGLSDESYGTAGARLASTAEEVFATADMI